MKKSKLVDLKAKTAPHDMIVWKRACTQGGRWSLNSRYIMVKLMIKKGTEIRLTGATTELRGRFDDSFKCRAAKAKILGFYPLTGKNKNRQVTPKKVTAWADSAFVYKKGKTIEPVWEFDKTKDVCASGIHFFQTRTQATKFKFN